MPLRLDPVLALALAALALSGCKPAEPDGTALAATPAPMPTTVQHDEAVAQRVGGLEIVRPWIRATVPNAPAAGGFLTIRNRGNQPDRLTALSTPGETEVQIHEMRMDGEVMRMRHLRDGLEIPAGGSVVLEPGGYHLMLMQPNAPFVAGQVVRMQLTFERAGSAEVAFPVRPVGAIDAGG